MSRPALVLAGEVEAALATGRAVVALETTIVTHGMPWPENFETALAVEAIIRDDGGAVPATIAVIDGKIRVGLDRATLEKLACGGDRGPTSPMASPPAAPARSPSPRR